MVSSSSPTNAHLHSEKIAQDLEATRESAQIAPFDDVSSSGFQAWLQVAAAFFIFMNNASLFKSVRVYQSCYTQGRTPEIRIRI